MHPLRTGHDTLPELPRMLRDLGLSGTAFLVSDSNVLPLHGERVRALMESGGWRVRSRAVPAGEASKSLECASELWDWLVSERAERGDILLALGGGVVGDLAGWVAATYLRGIGLVQVPTSLLAQVDSSVGGKTGINHPQAKNLIGSFYPPNLTLVDTSFLRTLPERELRSGWAEVIKTALVADPTLFEYILDNTQSLLRLETAPLAHVVGRCANLKLEVVTEDPKESGRRAILNYGHTLGHAIETAAGYGALLHGEAVAVGMRAAATIAVDLGMLRLELAARQAEALLAFGLPQGAPGIGARSVLEAMKLDKKVRSGGLRWVLLREIGAPEVRPDVPPELVRRVVKECLA